MITKNKAEIAENLSELSLGDLMSLRSYLIEIKDRSINEDVIFADDEDFQKRLKEQLSDHLTMIYTIRDEINYRIAIMFGTPIF